MLFSHNTLAGLLKCLQLCFKKIFSLDLHSIIIALSILLFSFHDKDIMNMNEWGTTRRGQIIFYPFSLYSNIFLMAMHSKLWPQCCFLQLGKSVGDCGLISQGFFCHVAGFAIRINQPLNFWIDNTASTVSYPSCVRYFWCLRKVNIVKLDAPELICQQQQQQHIVGAGINLFWTVWQYKKTDFFVKLNFCAVKRRWYCRAQIEVSLYQ